MVSIPSLSLEGKVAIVTAARRGINEANALVFAEAGADVAVADIRVDDGLLGGVAKKIREFGQRSLAIQADVSRKADVDNMVQKTVKELGGVDILVNGAAQGSRASLMEVSEEKWDRIMAVTLKGSLLCAQAVGKRMIEQGRGGKIINISSVDGIKALVNRAGHCEAKAGVIQLTRQLAIELAPHNIRVNCVTPGWTRTMATQDIWDTPDPEKQKQILDMIPLNRWAEPIDIATAILFLASDASNYITGATLVVDGGMIEVGQHSEASAGDATIKEAFR